MCRFILLAVLGFSLSLSSVSMAESLTFKSRNFTKSNLSRVKILSGNEGKISLYLIDQQEQTYRISSLEGKEAQSILDQLDLESGVQIKSQMSPSKAYFDVKSWH